MSTILRDLDKIMYIISLFKKKIDLITINLAILNNIHLIVNKKNLKKYIYFCKKKRIFAIYRQYIQY